MGGVVGGSALGRNSPGLTTSEEHTESHLQELSTKLTFTRSFAQSCPTLRPHGLQPARLPCPSLPARVCSDSCPLSRWCHPAVSSSVSLCSLCLQSYPGWVFSSESRESSVQSVKEFQHQCLHWIFRVNFLYGLLIWSPCSPRDSQESSPAPQFENIKSSALNLLYGPSLTSIHDYWTKP